MKSQNDLNLLFVELEEAERNERSAWGECAGVCTKYQESVGNTDSNITLSGYLNTPEYASWRKKWLMAESSVAQHRVAISAYVKNIHPRLTYK